MPSLTQKARKPNGSTHAGQSPCSEWIQRQMEGISWILSRRKQSWEHGATGTSSCKMQGNGWTLRLFRGSLLCWHAGFSPAKPMPNFWPPSILKKRKQKTKTASSSWPRPFGWKCLTGNMNHYWCEENFMTVFPEWDGLRDPDTFSLSFYSCVLADFLFRFGVWNENFFFCQSQKFIFLQPRCKASKRITSKS